MGPRKYRDKGGLVNKRVLRRHFNVIWEEYLLLRLMESAGAISSFDMASELKKVIEAETGGFCAILKNSTGNWLFKVIIDGEISPTINISNEPTGEILSEWFNKL